MAEAVAPAAGGAAPDANAPAAAGGGMGGIMRLVLMYMAFQYFFKGPAPTTDANGKVRPPHRNLWADGQAFDLRIYASDNKDFDVAVDVNPTAGEVNSLMWYQHGIAYDFTETNDRDENITLSAPLLAHLQANNSLYAHVYATKRGYSHVPGEKKHNVLATIYKCVQMNVHKARPKVNVEKNLLSGEFADTRVRDVEDVADAQARPLDYVSFWKPVIMPRLVHDFTVYPNGGIPPELLKDNGLMIEQTTGDYFPPLYMDEFWLLQEKYIIINETVKELPLQLMYSTISLMKWRFELQMEESWRMQSQFGQSSDDTDQLKRMLMDTNPVLLGITFAVSMLHMVFDFLAFKNDIAFWKNNKSLEGLSVQTIILNAVCQVIIFLYLLDNDTSMMILASSGIGLLIEFWKIKQCSDIERTLTFPYFKLKDKASYEKSETAAHDRQAMKYLSYCLYPLVIGYSIYSVMYNSHKSWYSWILNSLVGTVYTFGFIMMCPQLYLNYKLKSVAHLPWRMLTYKALNTFIDDLFAFIITMPTLHRLSCFRDDIIFFIYLYQRWIYRIDYKRVNEFGYQPKPEGAGDAPPPAQLPADTPTATTATAANGALTDASSTPTTEQSKVENAPEGTQGPTKRRPRKE